MEMFLKGLESLYPHFERDDIVWWKLARDAQTAPVYETGYAGRIVPYATNIHGLYLAGMFSQANYPERSMNGSINAGYEAAAATAVVVGVTSVPEPIVLDRPFIFFIRDIQTGAVLFVGRVVDPSA